MHVDELRPEREEHLSLTMLPLDVLHTILLQRGIGARELCALESTCLMFRQLVDEAAWQHAFVQRRRVNVLRAPQGWKQELSRRELWSRDWRQLVGCSSPTQVRLGLPTQKLRRLAAKMFYGCEGSSSSVASAGPRPHRHDTHAVDPSGRIPKSFATIGAALAHAKPYDLVLVEPGEYREQIKLDRHAQVIGNGPPGSVVIIGVDGPAVEATGRTASRVSNLVIKQMARAGGGAMSGAVLIKGGAPARDGSAARPSSLGGGRSYPWPWRPRACPEPLAANAASRPLLLPTPHPIATRPPGAVVLVEESQISSDVGHCVVIQGVDSCGYILHNAVANGRGVGVLVCDNGRGVVEDNDICLNGRAGVAILSGGDPLVCHNKIHEGMDSGVLVSEKGRGRIEDNDIFSNRRAGVAIFKEGAPLIKHNIIHDGCDSGVLVCENGQGSVVDNLIFANQMAGVAIGRGGASP